MGFPLKLSSLHDYACLQLTFANQPVLEFFFDLFETLGCKNIMSDGYSPRHLISVGNGYRTSYQLDGNEDIMIQFSESDTCDFF
jgi:hypothetical protein